MSRSARWLVCLAAMCPACSDGHSTVVTRQVSARAQPGIQATDSFSTVAEEDWTRFADDAAMRAAYAGGRGRAIWSPGRMDWSQVSLVSDRIWGRALRVTFPKQDPFYDLAKHAKGKPGATLRIIVKFPTPAEAVWVRGRFRFEYDAARQPYGWVTKSPNDRSPLGGSYKLFFLHWMSPYSERGSLVYTNTRRLDYEYYATGQRRTVRELGGSPGTSGGMNELSAPEFKDREWYEFVFLHHKTGATTSRAGSWVRRLTSGGGTTLAPGRWNWVLKDYTWSVAAPLAKSVEFGGNKNHGNEFDQWIVWGPWQVIDALRYPNPFGVPGA